jgi:hypothetical protein
MRVSGSQFCAQKIPFAGEAKQKMVADLLKVAVEGGAFLISMDGVFSGIDIDYEMTFISPSKQGVGGSAEAFFEGLQPLTCREDLVLESAECGLPGSTWRGLEFVPAPWCWVGSSENSTTRPPTREAVIAILIACRNLIDSLPQQLEQGMIRMSRRSRVVNLRRSATEDT